MSGFIAQRRCFSRGLLAWMMELRGAFTVFSFLCSSFFLLYTCLFLSSIFALYVFIFFHHIAGLCEYMLLSYIPVMYLIFKSALVFRLFSETPMDTYLQVRRLLFIVSHCYTSAQWPEVICFTAEVSYFFFFRHRISDMALPTGNLSSSDSRI